MVSIAILRPKEYLDKTEKLFSSAGFNVISVPFLKIEEEKLAVPNARFDYAVITSQTAARIILRNPGFLDSIRNAKIISIGRSTAEIFEEAGIKSVIPSKYDSLTLYNEFKGEMQGKKVAIFRSDKGDPVLLKLSEVAEIKEFVLYKIRFEHGKKQIEFLKRLVENEVFVDCIVFSSRMMVRSFFALAEELGTLDEVLKALRRIDIIAIGPPTRDELEKFGIHATIPEEYTFWGVLNLLKGSQNPKSKI